MRIALLFLLCFSTSAVSETIKLSSYHIPGLVENARQGKMIELLEAIEQQSDFKFTVNILPIRRVQLWFKFEKISGYFPELEEFRPANSCRTDAFMQKKIIAVTRKNDQLVTDVTQLRGRKVGAVSGYSYGLNIIEDPEIALQRVDSDQANLKKLMSGRIDIIIGDAHSTIAAIKEAGLEHQLRYDDQHPINLLDVFFVFLPDLVGENRCTYISEQIQKLRKDGTLYRLFGYR